MFKLKSKLEMPRNGSGLFTPTGTYPAAPNTLIESAKFNTFAKDAGDAITVSLAKDGQTDPTANLPMATYRHTGVGNAAALTDYTSASDDVDNRLKFAGTNATGTDDYVINLPISPSAYVAGFRFQFIADVSNTGACTAKPGTLAAKSIKMLDGSTPPNNAIIAGQIVDLEYDGTNLQLLNPNSIVLSAKLTAAAASISIGSLIFTADKPVDVIANLIGVGGTSGINLILNADALATNYFSIHVIDGATSAGTNDASSGVIINTSDIILMHMTISPNSTAGETVVSITTSRWNSAGGLMGNILTAQRYTVTDVITSIGFSVSTGGLLMDTGSTLTIKS